MGAKLLCLLVASVLVAYYIYIPLPENIEKPWKIMLFSAVFRTVEHVATLAEKLSVANYMDVLKILAKNTAPISDENVTVTDTTLNGVQVRLYVPKRQPDSLKRGVIYIHGGGWCVGGKAMEIYDLLSRRTSEKLHAIVVSVDYRLAPKYHFPAQFEDVYTVAKYFLQSSVLEQYNVDPSRVSISGDSAGGNLAAAVAQQLLDDPDVKVKLKIQALIYPALQPIDLNLPSYQDNANMPVLSKSLMLRFWSEYFTADNSLKKAMEANQLVPVELSHVFKFVNWSYWLPEKFKKGHIYTGPTYGSSKLVQKYPGVLDSRAAPLLVDDVKLHGLPLTYIVTCQYDVLRDDGLMYVSRLREAGVQVIHNHFDAFHGSLFYFVGPVTLNVGEKMANNYIEWLNKNL